MDNPNDSLPSVEIFKQLAESCAAIEVAYRAGARIDIDALVAAFPPHFQEMVRPELHGVLKELQTPDSQGCQFVEGSDYEVTSDYSVIEPLAQGGMGQVLVAWDGELSRRVALKQIHPNGANDERYHRRFLQESILTARLEHPGILPIYSRGVNSDECPFYTMRLIAGGNAKTLQQAIEEFQSLAPELRSYQSLLRDLLRRLIDVCNTVGYAHSQGICHRDLKPANILIGPFGETLVVDWGLAKVFQSVMTSQQELSIVGSPTHVSDSDGVGTRGFVAPECFGQAPIADWPRVDVFSLGAMLYCMLTSVAPGEHHRFEATRMKNTGLFPKSRGVNSCSSVVAPRVLNPKLSKALEAVCLKAISSEPQKRYATTLDLARDLENFLAGQPVSVLPEGPIDRIVRWINSNRKLAVASLVLGTLLSVSVGMLAIQQLTYNSELQEKSEKLTESLANEQELRQQENTARSFAEVQEQIARKREGLAISALRTFTDTIANNETLRDNRGLGPIRRELLEKPLALFERLEQDETFASNPSWEYFEQLASMSKELAKLSFEYGDRDQCNRWVDRSIVRYTKLKSLAEQSQLLGRLPSDRSQRLASATIALAGMYRLQGILRMPLDRDLSSNSLQKALDLLIQVGDDPKWAEQLLGERVEVHVNLGILAAELRDAQRMSEFFRLAIKEREELLQNAKDCNSLDPQVQESKIAQRQIELEKTLQDQAHLGLTLRHGDIESHFQQFERFIGSLRKQLEDGKAIEENRRGLCWTLRNLGLHLRNYGRPERSIVVLQEALDLRRDMTVLYPSVTRYRLDLAETAIDLSGTMIQLGRFDQATEYATQGIEGYRSLLSELPSDSSYRVNLVMKLHFVGHLYLNCLRDSGAENFLEEAFQLSKQLLDSHPAIQSIQTLYPELVWHHAHIQMLHANWREAMDSLAILWSTRTGNDLRNPMPNEERKKILDLWSYCCLRVGDSKAIEEVDHLKMTLLVEPNATSQGPIDDMSLLGRINKYVNVAEERLLSADKALSAEQSESAISFQRHALESMQQVVELLGSQTDGAKLPLNTVQEIWERTLRNPRFVTVRLQQELQRWPDQDRNPWLDIWQNLQSLAP